MERKYHNLHDYVHQCGVPAKYISKESRSQGVAHRESKKSKLRRGFNNASGLSFRKNGFFPEKERLSLIE